MQLVDYSEVLNYLYDHLPYYQRIGPAAYKGNLDNTLSLDQLFGHPHTNFRSIHIAGTNGKGSVSHMLASVLQEAGYKTGLYTSPHLKDFRERIKINGEMIPESAVVNFVMQFLDKNQSVNLEPSFFELTVLLAFDYFSKEKVDAAVIEVGLGGRLDSTNIITPELSVITNISLDHTALLGDSRGKIALEKAGIIKRGVPVIIGETHPQTSMIFEGIAAENRAPISFADQKRTTVRAMSAMDNRQIFTIKNQEKTLFEDLRLDLAGWYQSKNILTVLEVISQLQDSGWEITLQAIRDGLANVVRNTGLKGRWQTIGANPRIICDTGHNEAGIRVVVKQLRETPYKKLHFIIGMVNDKEISGVLALLPTDAVYYFTKASLPRALDEKVLMKMALNFDLHGKCFDTVSNAFDAAKKAAEREDLIFIGGSTFVVAEVLP